MGKEASKNIIIIGSGKTVFVRDFCKYVINPADTVMLISNDEEFDEDIYKAQGIIISKSQRFGGFKKEVRTEGKRIGQEFLKNKKQIDVCQIHYCDVGVITQFNWIFRKAKKRILTFWGSDIYTLKPSRYKWIKLYSILATDLIFMEDSLYDAFCKKIGKGFKRKAHIIDVGMPLFDEMKSLVMDDCKGECKKQFNIPCDKISVHLGYNGNPRQQHIEMLKSIGNLPKEIKDIIYITIPFGYAGTKEYGEDIKKALEESGVEGTLEEQFLDKKMTARFRNTCDVFVYAGLSDAGSESPIEYAYLGSKMIMPNWISSNYPMFEKTSYKCVEYNDVKKVGECLKNELFSDDSNGLFELREWLEDNKSWKHFAPMWKKVIED